MHSTFNRSIADVSYYTLTTEGDAICDRYYINEPDSLNNFIQLSKISETEIEGNFSATLEVELPKCNNNAPDTMRIRNATFKVQPY